MAITTGELVFVDTNVLLSATDTSRPAHTEALGLLKNMLHDGYSLVLCGQVIREYLVVATRPAESNGFGMDPGDAIHNIKEFVKKAVVYEERRSTAELLQHLVVEYQLKGKRIHDANIVAVMKTHGIKCLITDNVDDFACFDGITTLPCVEAADINGDTQL